MKNIASRETRYVTGAVGIAVLLIALSFLFSGYFLHTQKAEAATQVTINGWLWSDTIGWISANCATTGTCGTVNYGLQIDTTTGTLSGYAWSDNVGWISANSADLTGCPTSPCTAKITGTALTGWFKVIAGGGSQSGGWDGFISLSGAGYGATFSSGVFGGYAWGDTNVGWVSFTLATSTYGTCTPTTVYTCQDTQTITQTVTQSSCEVTTVNTTCVAPQFCSAGAPTCFTPPPTDFPTGGGSTLTGHITAKPNLVPKNATTTIYWGVVNVTGCNVSGSDGTAWSGAFSATSSCATKYQGGCVTAPITAQTVYTLSCTDFDSKSYIETVNVNILPAFEEQ